MKNLNLNLASSQQSLKLSRALKAPVVLMEIRATAPQGAAHFAAWEAAFVYFLPSGEVRYSTTLIDPQAKVDAAVRRHHQDVDFGDLSAFPTIDKHILPHVQEYADNVWWIDADGSAIDALHELARRYGFEGFRMRKAVPLSKLCDAVTQRSADASPLAPMPEQRALPSAAALLGRLEALAASAGVEAVFAQLTQPGLHHKVRASRRAADSRRVAQFFSLNQQASLEDATAFFQVPLSVVDFELGKAIDAGMPLPAAVTQRTAVADIRKRLKALPEDMRQGAALKDVWSTCCSGLAGQPDYLALRAAMRLENVSWRTAQST